MNRINDITFTGIKYTSAGRIFASNQSKKSQVLLQKAEKEMKNYRYTNFVVNKNGYSIQYADETGKHSTQLKDIRFTCDNDVIFILKNKQRLRFSFLDELDMHQKCALAASIDASENNSNLNSSIILTNLLEHKNTYPIKKNFFEKLKDYITK